MPNNSADMTSYRKQATGHMISVARQPVAAAAAAAAGMMCFSNAVHPPPPPFAALPCQQFRPLSPPFPALNALRAATEPPPTIVPPSSMWDPRPGAPNVNPSASSVGQIRSVRFQGWSALAGSGLQSAPLWPPVPRRSDFRPEHRFPQQQQQQQPQASGTCSPSQLKTLLLHHRHVCDGFMRKVDLSLDVVFGGDLRSFVANSGVPSSAVRGLLDELWQLIADVDAARWQHRVAYSAAHDVALAQIDRGHARLHPNVVRENARAVRLCSQHVEAVAFELRRLLLLLPPLTDTASPTPNAGVGFHVGQLRRSVDFFSEALKAFCRLLVPSAGHAADAGRNVSRSDTAYLQKAFSDDVDQLILTQQQQQWNPVVIAQSTSVPVLEVSTLPVVDGLSDTIRPPDSRALTENVNTARQIDEPDATSTSAMGTEDDVRVVATEAEMKFSHVLRSRHPDLGRITVDDVDDDLPPFCDHDDSGLADPREATAADAGSGLDETKIVAAVDLMSLGGFNLFMPFSVDPPQDFGEPRRSAGSAAPSSDSGDSGIVKTEPAGVVEDVVLPTEDVISTPDQNAATNADVLRPEFCCPNTVDVGSVEGYDNSPLFCRIESVYSIPPDRLEAAETSLLSSPAEQRPSTVGNDGTDYRVSPAAAGVDRRSSSQRGDSIPTSARSSTVTSSSKVGDPEAWFKQPVGRRRQSRMLTLTEISRALRKRKSSAANGDRRKRLRTDSKTPAVFAASPASWVVQKKLLIPSPAGAVKKRRGRPPKQRVDTVAMPSPAELKRRPAARSKILALYRSSQFTPLDGSKRATSAPCRRATVDERPAGGKSGGPGQGRGGEMSGATESTKYGRIPSVSGATPSSRIRWNKSIVEPAKSRAGAAAVCGDIAGALKANADLDAASGTPVRPHHLDAVLLADNSLQPSAAMSPSSADANVIATQSYEFCDDDSARVESAANTDELDSRRTGAPGGPLHFDASPAPAGVGSPPQSAAKSTAVAELIITTDSSALGGDTPLSGVDDSTRVEPAAVCTMCMSSVENNTVDVHLGAAVQQVIGQNSSTASQIGLNSATATADDTAIAVQSWRPSSIRILEELLNVDDIDEDPGRLVIDMDCSDPHASASDCSISSDLRNNHGGIPTAASKSGCCPADEITEKNATPSVTVICSPEADEVIASATVESATDVQLGSDVRAKTTSGGDAATSGHVTPTSVKPGTWPAPVYSDISDAEEDDDTAATSSTFCDIHRQEVAAAEVSTLPAAGGDRAVPEKPQTSAVALPTRQHPSSVDLDRKHKHVEVRRTG